MAEPVPPWEADPDAWSALSVDERRVRYCDYLVHQVEREGFAVQFVHPTEPLLEGLTPHFAYTVGLWPDMPELMVRGYGDWCPDVVANVAEALSVGELDVDDREQSFGADPGKVVLLPWADVTWGVDDWGMAVAFHGTVVFDRRLVVLADDDGRFPWEGGAHVVQLLGLDGLWHEGLLDRVPEQPEEVDDGGDQ